MTKRTQAIELLQHYVRLASEGKGIRGFGCDEEIAKIINLTVDATIEEMTSRMVPPAQRDAEWNALLDKIYKPPAATPEEPPLTWDEIHEHAQKLADLTSAAARKASGMGMMWADFVHQRGRAIAKAFPLPVSAPPVNVPVDSEGWKVEQTGHYWTGAGHEVWEFSIITPAGIRVAIIPYEGDRDRGKRMAQRMAAAEQLYAGCRLALGAFENNNAIDWGEIEQAINLADGKS